MTKPEVLLYDDVHRWTYSQPREVLPETFGFNSPEGEKILRNYRVNLRQAQRFYIDDELLNVSLDMSRDMERVKKWTNLARLPYDTMWLEFNCHEKVKNSRKNGSASALTPPPDFAQYVGIPERMGFLLQTINRDSGAWAKTIFSSFSTELSQPDAALDPSNVFLHAVCYFLAPEGPSVDVMHPPKPWDIGGGPWGGAPDAAVLDGYAHAALGVGDPAFPNLIGYIPEFKNRVQVCQEPFWMNQLRLISPKLTPKGQKEYRNLMADAFTTSLREEAGLVRWLIALLAMLNAAPNVKHYHAAAVGHRMKRGREVPYLDHNVITVKLPKTKPIPILTKLLDHASAERRRNRAHMVRGHFRAVEMGKVLPFRCKHEPTLVENGIGYCLRCERKIKWIAQHPRGDASVGWVNHEYVLEAS